MRPKTSRLDSLEIIQVRSKTRKKPTKRSRGRDKVATSTSTESTWILQEQQLAQDDVMSREATNCQPSTLRDAPGTRTRMRILRSLRRSAAKRSRVKVEQSNRSTSTARELPEMTTAAIKTPQIQ